MDKYFARTNEIHEKLQELYPQIFSIDNPKLLKIGINKDIKAEGKIEASSQEFSRFFRYFCTRPTYTKQQVIGAKRYNLLGKEDGEVTEKDLEAKSISLANIKAKNKALKKKKDYNIQKPEITTE
jgi:sRNA-binding protein